MLPSKMICIHVYMQNTWTDNISEAVFTDPPVSYGVTMKYTYITIHIIIIKVEEVRQLLKECGVPQNDTSRIISYLKVHNRTITRVCIRICIEYFSWGS